ncbi:MAG: MaoC family dehydratase [Candidatus Izimaplasma sp.]|nr:MaoC family dehydratase [Candidatus Izimaplasma bacterium]
MKLGKTIYELHVGDTVSHTKHITKEDVEQFGEIIKDYNPAHFDATYAKQTMFKKRISHGMLIGSLFSGLLGTQLPGNGTIYTKQSLIFTQPVYFEDDITASITVKTIDIFKNRVTLTCEAINQNGKTVIKGEAEVMPPVKKEGHNA